MQRRGRQQRGMVLFLTLLAIVPLALLTQVSLGRSLTSVRAARRVTDVNRAFQLAETGIDEVLVELRSSEGDFKLGDPPDGESWCTIASTSQNCVTTNGGDCLTTDCVWKTMALPGGQAYVAVIDWDGPRPTVRSRGTVAQTMQRLETILEVQRTNSPFQEAVFGDVRAGFADGFDVDAYNSCLGAYGATPVSPADPIFGSVNQSTAANPASWLGDVRTDGLSSDPKAIGYWDYADIYGKGTIGPGGSTALAISGGGTKIYGGVSASTVGTREFSPVTFTVEVGTDIYNHYGNCTTAPADITVVDFASKDVASDGVADNTIRADKISGGNGCEAQIIGPAGSDQGILHLRTVDFSVDNPKIKFKKPTGFSGNQTITVYVSGDVRLGNSMDIELDPGMKVKFYVAGKFDSGSGPQINFTNDRKPSNFLITTKYNAGYTNQVGFGNGGTIYATIYSPENGVALGGTGKSFYGAVIGKTVTGSHSIDVHHDIATRCDGQCPCDPNNPPENGSITGVQIRSWRHL